MSWLRVSVFSGWEKTTAARPSSGRLRLEPFAEVLEGVGEGALGARLVALRVDMAGDAGDVGDVGEGGKCRGEGAPAEQQYVGGCLAGAADGRSVVGW